MVDAHRTFVLDTNVLIHDPSALYRFKEHDLYIPMMVLEELDAIKKGGSEVARNARQASRFLDQLISKAETNTIADGLPLPSFSNGGGAQIPTGKLFCKRRPSM